MKIEANELEQQVRMRSLECRHEGAFLADDAEYEEWLDYVDAQNAMLYTQQSPPSSVLMAHEACGIDPMTTWPEHGPTTGEEDFTPEPLMPLG